METFTLLILGVGISSVQALFPIPKVRPSSPQPIPPPLARLRRSLTASSSAPYRPILLETLLSPCPSRSSSVSSSTTLLSISGRPWIGRRTSSTTVRSFPSRIVQTTSSRSQADGYLPFPSDEMLFLSSSFGADVLEASPPSGQLGELQLFLSNSSTWPSSIYNESIKAIEDRDESCEFP